MSGEDTAGSFCLLVDYPPAGWSLPPHRHRGVAETIYVVEGDFEMSIAGRRARLAAGQTVHIPADATHAGSSIGPCGGRRIVIFSPAGMENFFLEVGESSRETDIDVAAAVAAATRHGWEFVI